MSVELRRAVGSVSGACVKPPRRDKRGENKRSGISASVAPLRFCWPRDWLCRPVFGRGYPGLAGWMNGWWGAYREKAVTVVTTWIKQVRPMLLK